jgi:nitrogen fixation NifU-like protein
MPRGLTNEEFDSLRRSGYSEKAIRFYADVVNFGFIENPDVSLDYAGPCGDSMRFHLKIDDNGVIKDVKFQCLGCLGAVASGSAVAEMARGKKLGEAKKIAEEDVIEALEGLPESEHDCAKLAVVTLRKTITRYEEDRKRVGNASI